MVDEFHRAATPDEKAELEEWYGVEQVFNLQDRRHIASISLFWKNVKASDPDLPEPTRDRMKRALVRWNAIGDVAIGWPEAALAKGRAAGEKGTVRAVGCLHGWVVNPKWENGTGSSFCLEAPGRMRLG